MMRAILCAAILACVFASDKVCKKNGQILSDSKDPCSYILCGYGKEPWKDNKGVIQLVAEKTLCAPGTGVNLYHFDPENPCSEFNSKCSPPLPPKKEHQIKNTYKPAYKPASYQPAQKPSAYRPAYQQPAHSAQQPHSQQEHGQYAPNNYNNYDAPYGGFYKY